VVIPAPQFLSFEMACRTALTLTAFHNGGMDALLDLRDEENQ
jgi:hypothetical protein